MINDYENGGLKMIDIKSFNKALKSAWVKKYLDKDNHGKWKLFLDFEPQELGGADTFKSNLNTKDLLNLYKVQDTFTAEILSIWSEINYDDAITFNNQFLSTNLWENSLIRIENKAIHYRSWSFKGVQKVEYLMKDRSNFLTLSEFKQRFQIKTNFLAFHGVISAIKSLKKAREDQHIKH